MDASIIIPSYNRMDSLLKTLEGFKNQSYPLDRYEVVVIDDGSTDETSEVSTIHFPFHFSYHYQPNQGSASARNTGAERSTGSILIFVDDDILVEPAYIEGLVEEHETCARIIAMAAELPFLENEPTLFQRIRSVSSRTKTNLNQSEFVQYTNCVTNNLSIERKDFFEIGMMQDVAGDGPTWWGDVDLGYRAHRAGYNFRRSGKAICYHDDYSNRSLRSSSQRAYQVSQMVVLLFQKYPGVFHDLPMFHDKAPIDWANDPLKMKIRKCFRSISGQIPFLWGMENITRLIEVYPQNHTLLRSLYRWIIGAYIYRGFHQGLRAYGHFSSE